MRHLLYPLAVLAGLVATVCGAAPASAHGDDAPIAVPYRVHVTAVSVPGVAVRAVEGGARLELRNASGRTVEVLGLQGEPFLRVRVDGAEANLRSPTYVASRSLDGARTGGDAALPPEWSRASRTPVVRWHDDRARELPARAWSIPLLVDGAEPGVIRGTIERPSPPPAPAWWIGVLIAAGLVVLIGLPRFALGLPRVAAWALGLVALAGGGTATAFAIAAAALATAEGASVVEQLFARVWPLLTGLAVLAAGLAVVLRRPAADFAITIAGAGLALMAGFANGAVFSNAVVAGPGWTRPAVAVALAGGLGLAGAGGLRWYRSTPRGPADAERPEAVR